MQIRIGGGIEKEQKSLAKCPELLEQYIDLVNMIPYDQKLLDGKEIYKRNIDSYLKNIELFADVEISTSFTPTERALLEATNKTLEECLADLPEIFCGYIREKGWRECWGYQKQENYEYILARRTLSEYMEFYQTREDLKSFVEYFANWRKRGLVTFGSDGLFGADGKRVGLPAVHATFVKEDTKHGFRVTVEPEGLSAALDGIIGDRVRSCEMCHKIFWAQRKESETCSTQCANKLRVRRYRDKTDNKTSKTK